MCVRSRCFLVFYAQLCLKDFCGSFEIPVRGLKFFSPKSLFVFSCVLNQGSEGTHLSCVCDAYNYELWILHMSFHRSFLSQDLPDLLCVHNVVEKSSGWLDWQDKTRLEWMQWERKRYVLSAVCVCVCLEATSISKRGTLETIMEENRENNSRNELKPQTRSPTFLKHIVLKFFWVLVSYSQGLITNLAITDYKSTKKKKKLFWYNPRTQLLNQTWSGLCRPTSSSVLLVSLCFDKKLF